MQGNKYISLHDISGFNFKISRKVLNNKDLQMKEPDKEGQSF